MSRTNNSWKRCGAVGAILLIGGCALIDPHQHAPELDDHSYANPKTGEPFAGDLAVAIDDANAQRNRYLGAVVQASEVENGAPLVAGGLVIPALLLGATGGGSANLRLGLASGGAAAFAFSRLYDTRTRQMIWLNGADAIGCAVATQRPLLVPMSIDSRLPDEVQRVRDGLDALATALRDHPSRVRGYRWDNNMIASLRQAATSDVASVTQLIQARASAGLVLRERVRSIQIAVDKQLISTNPDPNAVFALVRDFTGALQTLAPAQATMLTPTDAGKPNAVASTTDPVDSAAEDLKKAVDALAGDMPPPGQVAEAQAALARCALADLPNSFSVSPNETLHVVNKVPATLTYVVHGGSGQIAATISQTDAPDGAITAKAVVQPDRSFQVQVSMTADAVGHKAELLISDDSRQPPRQILLNVLNASASPPPAKKTGANPQPPKVATFSPNQLDVVRQALGFPASGAATLSGPEQTKLGKSLDSKVYATLLAQFRQTRLMQAPSPDEVSLIPSKQAALLRQKCLPSPPNPDPGPQKPGETIDAYAARIFDSAFRGAIFDFQSATDQKGGKLMISGLLDIDTASAIDANACKGS